MRNCSYKMQVLEKKFREKEFLEVENLKLLGIEYSNRMNALKKVLNVNVLYFKISLLPAITT